MFAKPVDKEFDDEIDDEEEIDLLEEVEHEKKEA